MKTREEKTAERGCFGDFCRAHRLRAKLQARNGIRYEIRRGDLRCGAAWTAALETIYPRAIGG